VLVCHLERIVGKLIETVRTDLFIADVDPCSETGKVNVDPIWVLRYGVEEAAVLDYVCIDRIFEAIGIAGAVESLVFVTGKIDPEISPAFWGIGAVTGKDAGEGQQ
jgi:hypothetical protein